MSHFKEKCEAHDIPFDVVDERKVEVESPFVSQQIDRVQEPMWQLQQAPPAPQVTGIPTYTTVNHMMHPGSPSRTEYVDPSFYGDYSALPSPAKRARTANSLEAQPRTPCSNPWGFDF